MHQEKYSLTWETYSDHLKGLMKELMMNEDFSDITFVTEDKKQIKANINILSACSPIFKDILKKEKNSRQIMYLRGIQFSEIESILQFVYLGEATFYEERMDEFLAVAKSLEIKVLCNADPESNLDLDDKSLPINPNTADEKVKEQTVMSNHMTGQVPEGRQREVVSVNRKYKCDKCDYIAGYKHTLTEHIQSVHEGVKYACNKCDYLATTQGNLTKHIQSRHEGIKYACDQCDYKAGYRSDLTKHMKSKHAIKELCNAESQSNMELGDGKYKCDQCDYYSTEKGNFTKHVQSKHEGVKYACVQCDYQSGYQSDLKKHIQSRHEGIKYACDQCDSQLTTQATLARHIKSTHE